MRLLRRPTWKFARARRAGVRTTDIVSRFGGAVLLAFAFAFVGTAIAPPPTPSDWSTKFAYGVGVAAIGLVLVWGLVWMWQRLGYWLSGYCDPRWEAKAQCAGVDVLRFSLSPREHANFETVSVHGIMACRVSTPSGSKSFSDRELFAPKGQRVIAELHGAGSGTYEVTWYGSRTPQRFYEVTRATFVMEAADTREVLPRDQRPIEYERRLYSRGEWSVFGRLPISNQPARKFGKHRHVSAPVDTNGSGSLLAPAMLQGNHDRHGRNRLGRGRRSRGSASV